MFPARNHMLGNFLSGRYVALGWLHDIDLRDGNGYIIPMEDIIRLIKQRKYRDEKKAIYAHTQFYKLEPNDYVAVNNVNHGLFGVGRIKSAYEFSKNMHDSGNEETMKWYSHYRVVRWEHTKYVERRRIIRHGEKMWKPFGAVGYLEEKVPAYIERLLLGNYPH